MLKYTSRAAFFKRDSGERRSFAGIFRVSAWKKVHFLHYRLDFSRARDILTQIYLKIRKNAASKGGPILRHGKTLMNQQNITASAVPALPGALKTPVDALYNGIRNRLFLRESAAFCAGAFFLAGGLVLAWRMAFPEWRRDAVVLSCVLLVLAALAGALYRAVLLTPPKRKLTVWLDAHTDCGGFLAASLETDCSAWASKIRIPRTPDLNMEFPAARLTALLTAALFFAGAFLIDTEQARPDGPGSLDVHEEQAELESKLEILEQEPLVPQEEIEAAKEELAELVENSAGTSPAKAFEGIEALRDLTDSLAANASRALEHSAENFERLSQAASALTNLPPEVRGRTKAMEQFKQLAEQLAADDAALAEFLKQSGDNLAASMTPEQLQSLADAMAGNAQGLRDRLEKLAQARRDQMMQQSGQGQGEGQGGETGLANDSDYENSAEALQQWLEENAPGASELSDAAGQGQGSGQGEGSGAGSGGNSRGRGDALLNFTGQTQDVGDKRRDLMLDNNTPGQSVSILEFATTPGEETAERAKAGQLSGSGQAAEHAETRILPSHRESVRRYFNNSPAQQ